MILNTGSRTDIPAYYSEWFYNRIREGYVLVRNPYDPGQVIRYRLTPDVVDCLCFCTKNPEPMLGRLSLLDGFRQVWYVTITPYGKDVEPHVPDKKQVMKDFCRLSEKVGPRALIWRYDPIFVSEKYSLDFHLKSFKKMAAALSGCTESCIISFIDLYEKTKRNFPGVQEVAFVEQAELAKAFVEIANRFGIAVKSCCETEWLIAYGVDVSGCMTKEVMEHAMGENLAVPKHPAAREGCNCLLGNDIGMYNTCLHGCKYCYANYDSKTVEENYRKHDPTSPLLIGWPRKNDLIREAKQESWIDGQLRLF